MFGLGEKPKVRGNGYVALNILRAFSIVSLTGMSTSNMVLAVKGAMMGSFTGFGFFALLSGLLTSLFSLFLLISECDLPKVKGWIHQYFPVLSPTHSLGWLGMVMIFLGVDLLGNLNSSEYTSNNLSLPFWRLALASAILCFIFGFCNLFSTFVFREHGSTVTDRLIRSDGSLAKAKEFNTYDSYSARSASVKETPIKEKRGTRFSMPWHAKASRPQISGPIHLANGDLESQTVVDDPEHWEKEDRSSPILPDVERPPTALHPANRYSLASNVTRF